MGYILSYCEKILPFALIFSLLYIGIRGLTIRKNTSLAREGALFLFHLFLIAILSQTLTRDGSIYSLGFSAPELSRDTVNIIPFKVFSRLSKMSGEDFRYFLTVNVIGNILLFVPLGFFHRLTVRSRLWQSALFGLILSCAIELIQTCLPSRATDIDDVILNFLGVTIGAAIASILLRHEKLKLDRFQKTQP